MFGSHNVIKIILYSKIIVHQLRCPTVGKSNHPCFGQKIHHRGTEQTSLLLLLFGSYVFAFDLAKRFGAIMKERHVRQNTSVEITLRRIDLSRIQTLLGSYFNDRAL